MIVKKIIIHPIRNENGKIFKDPGTWTLILPNEQKIVHKHDPQSDQPQTYDCDFSYKYDHVLKGFFKSDRLAITVSQIPILNYPMQMIIYMVHTQILDTISTTTDTTKLNVRISNEGGMSFSMHAYH